jgi:intein/homing endonuclease
MTKNAYKVIHNYRTKYFKTLIDAMFYTQKVERLTGKVLAIQKTIKYKLELKYNNMKKHICSKMDIYLTESASRL